VLVVDGQIEAVGDLDGMEAPKLSTWHVSRCSGVDRTARGGHHRRGKMTDIVGDGAKSGAFTALDRDTGAVLWANQVTEGGLTGGMQWGSATYGSRI
jgi:hypothetical protein